MSKKIEPLEKQRFCTVIIKNVSIEDIAAIRKLLDARHNAKT